MQWSTARHFRARRLMLYMLTQALVVAGCQGVVHWWHFFPEFRVHFFSKACVVFCVEPFCCSFARPSQVCMSRSRLAKTQDELMTYE